MYFNRKYKSQGHVFQSVFRASHITSEIYLTHISRYIHLNPETYLTYKWSSLQYYLGAEMPKWMSSRVMINMTPPAYKEFLEDYTDRRQVLKDIKDQLVL